MLFKTRMPVGGGEGGTFFRKGGLLEEATDRRLNPNQVAALISISVWPGTLLLQGSVYLKMVGVQGFELRAIDLLCWIHGFREDP